jgi:hypothetical protein
VSRYEHFGEVEVFYQLLTGIPQQRVGEAIVVSAMTEVYTIDTCIFDYILIDYPCLKKSLIR